MNEKINKYVIDFRNIKHYGEFHPIIKHSLDFPDYYGCNWSALWDCLTDMFNMKIHIEILGLDVIERKFDGTAQKFVEILKKYKHYDYDRYSNDILIEIVSGDKRVKIE